VLEAKLEIIYRVIKVALESFLSRLMMVVEWTSDNFIFWLNSAHQLEAWLKVVYFYLIVASLKT
jgi:hypothetical protein